VIQVLCSQDSQSNVSSFVDGNVSTICCLSGLESRDSLVSNVIPRSALSKASTHARTLIALRKMRPISGICVDFSSSSAWQMQIASAHRMRGLVAHQKRRSALSRFFVTFTWVPSMR
jgi:hypothetical protein